jgi:hypothetical protein
MGLKSGGTIGLRRSRVCCLKFGLQHWLTPCWKLIGGGCHLDRKMDDLIRTAAFQFYALEMGCMKGPEPWTFMYRGSATI